MKNQIIFELYTDDNKSKYSSNLNGILKFAKKREEIMKRFTPSDLPQLLLLHLFAKFRVERKYVTNNLIFVRLKYL